MYQHRRILKAISLSEIRSKYIGTTLGLAWSFMYPILFLGLYAVVYTLILKVKLANMSTVDYVLLIFSGLIPFLGFSEALSTGVSSVIANRGLIKNTLFPIELIPVKAVLSSSTTMLVGLCFLLPILWFQHGFLASQLFLPVILFLQLTFSCGLIWVLSALNVFFRDLGQVISVIILFLMLISPIGYTTDMIPPKLISLMYPNPLYYLITLYRECLISGNIPIKPLEIFTVITFIFFTMGYYIFSRLKVVFADYV
jgi:lipopolysaccharide transport system permease protein